MNAVCNTANSNDSDNGDEPKVLQLKDHVDLAALVKLKPTTKDLDNHLGHIASSHDKWYQNEHATSRKALHGIVGQAYAYFIASKSPDTPRLVRAQMWSAVNDRVASRNAAGASIRFNPEVHDAAKLLKAVFGYKNRQRISSCSKVLAVAREENVPASEFVEWLAREGGIEAIRLRSSRKGKGKSMAQKAQEGRDALPSAPRAKFKPDLAKLAFGSDDLNSKCVLIAEYTETGELEIYEVVRNAAALKAAYASIAK